MELKHLSDNELQQYLDKSDSLAPELEEHLKNCPQCQGELHLYQKLAENISADERSVLPETFSDQVMAKVKKLAPVATPIEDRSTMQILLASAMSLAGGVVVLYFFFGFERIITQMQELYTNVIHVEKWSLVVYFKAQLAKMGTTGELMLAAGLTILIFFILDKYLSKIKPGKASFLSI